MSKVMLIAPHADDELFGAGGTLLRMKDEGHSIKLVLVACSSVFMRHMNDNVKGSVREDEFRKSASVLSTEEPVIYFGSDSKLDAEPIVELITKIDRALDEFSPDVLFIPEPSYHQDHQYVYRACVAALRPTKDVLPGRVLSYEVPTSTGVQEPFLPNVYIDIAGYLEEKKHVLKDVYISQCDEGRGRLTLVGMVKHGNYRGVESGLTHAEAFMLLREVI